MTAERRRKYNNPNDLDELCRSFLQCRDMDQSAALDYCKDFLTLLNKKELSRGAVLSNRAKSR